MAASWVITGDLPDQYSTTGTSTPILGHQISFLTGKGNRGSVFVSNDSYTTTAIKPAVQLQANMADAVSELSSSG